MAVIAQRILSIETDRPVLIGIEGFYRHAFDVDAIRRHLLIPLTGSGEYVYRTSSYDFLSMKPDLSAPYQATPDSLVIVDGLFLFIPELVAFWDFRIFLDTPFDVCVERAKVRNQERLEDAAAVEKRYLERFWPGYEMYLDQVGPKRLADVVIKSDGAAQS